MMLLPDGRILLSGGATVGEKGIPTYHKDLRQLNTETMLWSKAKTAGGTPDKNASSVRFSFRGVEPVLLSRAGL